MDIKPEDYLHVRAWIRSGLNKELICRSRGLDVTPVIRDGFVVFWIYAPERKWFA